MSAFSSNDRNFDTGGLRFPQAAVHAFALDPKQVLPVKAVMM
jgi:hypothetical protein